MQPNAHARYRPIPAAEVPAGLRWDTPARNQGQTVEASYAHATPHAVPADYGEPYARAEDRSLPVSDIGRVTYYKREV